MFPPRALWTFACVTSPALAFAGLLYVEQMTAHASLPVEPEPTQVALVAPPSSPAPSVTAAADPRPAPDAAPSPSSAEAAAPTVPDLSGLRLSLARRRARELGLKLVARDEYGERIPPEVAQHYRVRKQLTAPGSELAEGESVQVRVRAIGEAAMGY